MIYFDRTFTHLASVSRGASSGQLLRLSSQIHWGAFRELFCSPSYPLVFSVGTRVTLGKSYLLQYLQLGKMRDFAGCFLGEDFVFFRADMTQFVFLMFFVVLGVCSLAFGRFPVGLSAKKHRFFRIFSKT